MRFLLLFLCITIQNVEALQVNARNEGGFEYQVVFDNRAEEKALQKDIKAFVGLFPKKDRKGIEQGLLHAELSLENGTLPENFWEKLVPFTFLKKLSLVCCDIEHLDGGIGVFKELVFLNLSNNGLLDLPQEMSPLTKLQTLDLRGNAFETLPVFIAAFKNLTELHLERNFSLKFFPKAISKLSNVHIYLSKGTPLNPEDKNEYAGYFDLGTALKMHFHVVD